MREIEGIVDFMWCECMLIIYNSIDLKEECARCFLNPSMFINSNDFSFIVSVVFDVRNSHFFTGFV